MGITEFIVGQSLAAFTPIKYNLKLIELLYNDSLYKSITNTKYEGLIKDAGDRVRVRTAGKITLADYTKGMKLVRQELTPTTEDLIVDQQKYFSFGVDDIDKFQNDTSAINEYAASSKRDMAEVIDTALLDYAAKNVYFSNAVGTNYATGTVSIAATTGVVTGTGTTFTSAMIGGILKVVGQTKGYLVTARASNTSITVVDQGSTTYTGGLFSLVAAGQDSFTIYAATVIAATKSTIYKNLVDLSTAMSGNLAPRDGRWIVVNAAVEGIIRQASEFIPAVQSAYSGVVEYGRIGSIAGFKVYTSELIAGNNSTGFYIVAGTSDYMSMAMQIMKVSVVPSESDPQSFITTVKGLLVYGFKAFEQNRRRGGMLKITVS